MYTTFLVTKENVKPYMRSLIDSFSQKLSQYGEKILYTYVYHLVGYLGKCEALHEIIDLMHEMVSVCAPLRCTYTEHLMHEISDLM